MDVRDLVADLVFIVRSPVDGVEPAINESARLSGAWLKIATVFRALNNVLALPRGYRRELVSIASSYFIAGSDPSITFLALVNKYEALLRRWLDWSREALTTVIVVAIMIGVASFLTILGSPPMISLIGIALVPFIHYYQVELVRYDYVKPTIAGLIGGSTAYLIGHYLMGLVGSRLVFAIIMGSCTAFAIAYIPQFIGFVKNYLGMPQRVLNSFGELLTLGNPQPPKPLTIIEKELRPLWDYAYGAGDREFVERVIIVVNSLIDFVRDSVRVGLIYGPFTAVGYVFMLFTAYVLTGIHAMAITGVPITLNPQLITQALIPMAVATSILVGESMHSIGLGISLLPILLMPLIPLIW
ncbi:hypothetical protein VMUT_1007 [Vulcanisaeta moutnovskia 768-28]|uniref:Uncharacterized protein n=1 Tax=Vulcanisaeta moutnovskia (strain 768-28) TaxID=985053 RepID=F0QXQ1_VULM7|nr:hypothetical protein [Vulcanisaeta moutnovskia]ADY01214.1 hypothetical protein VMUT_1007 [Vulcanisaeta moutnovskia 768-28]